MELSNQPYNQALTKMACATDLAAPTATDAVCQIYVLEQLCAGASRARPFKPKPGGNDRL